MITPDRNPPSKRVSLPVSGGEADGRWADGWLLAGLPGSNATTMSTTNSPTTSRQPSRSHRDPGQPSILERRPSNPRSTGQVSAPPRGHLKSAGPAAGTRPGAICRGQDAVVGATPIPRRNWPKSVTAAPAHEDAGDRARGRSGSRHQV